MFHTQVAGVDVTVASDMRYYHQWRALQLLTRNASLAHKVHVFQLARVGYEVTADLAKTWIYTHAKNYLADDEFMLVGSHGIEQTGWTNDIELSLGVTDGTAGPDSVVGKLRRKIWAEFLRLDPSDPVLRDPNTAIAEIERQAGLGEASRIRRYYPIKMDDSWAEDQVYKIYEPDGRC